MSGADSRRTFRISDQLAQVVVDEVIAAEASSCTQLTEMTAAFLLERGQSVAIEADPEARAMVLAALRPGEEALEFLDDMQFDDDFLSTAVLDRWPVDLGVVVDGSPWGWYWTDVDEWRLLPISFFEDASTLASLNDWMSASMTGVVIQAECVRTFPIAVSFLMNDIDGVQFLAVDYEAVDPSSVVKLFFEGVFGDGEPLCFICDTGWVTTVFVDDSVPDDVVAECLSMRWDVCPEHQAEASQWLLESASRSWTWTGDGFSRQEPNGLAPS